jgi:hypothetical protein
MTSWYGSVNLNFAGFRKTSSTLALTPRTSVAKPHFSAFFSEVSIHSGAKSTKVQCRAPLLSASRPTLPDPEYRSNTRRC